MFKPKAQPATSDEKVEFDRQAAIDALQTLVKCKTVSNVDPNLEDNSEFEKLIASLPGLYPRVFDVCSVRQLPDRGLLLRWPGSLA